MDQTAQKNRLRAGNRSLKFTLGMGVLISLLWIAALVWMVLMTEPCPTPWWEFWMGERETILDRLLERLECAAPNELGDFLAGAFAPLAFGWFVLAVLLQTMELKAQRDELHLANEAASDHAQSARENAAIMKIDQDLKIMEDHIRNVASRLIATPEFVYMLLNKRNSSVQFESLVDVNKIHEWKTYEELIYRSFKRLAGNWNARQYKIVEKGFVINSIVSFNEVYDAAMEAFKFGISLDGVAKSKFETSGLKELCKVLEEIRDSEVYPAS